MLYNSLEYWTEEIKSSAIGFCNASAGWPYEEEFCVNAVYKAIRRNLKKGTYDPKDLKWAAKRAKLYHHRVRKAYIRDYLKGLI